VGLADRVIDGLRQVFGAGRDERESAESPSADALKHAPASIYSIWGREDIGGLLSVSQALQVRLADYEAMNDYPDIRCFTGDMKVYVVEEGGTITPVPLSIFAAEGEGREILAFDREKMMLVKVVAERPRLVHQSAPVVKVKLSNGEWLRTTYDHKVLMVERGYVEAAKLRKGDLLIGARAGFELHGRSMLTNYAAGAVWVAEDPQPDGAERVYDVTTSTHNLLVNGVIAHNSAFHYFANDACQPNLDNGRVVWVTSKDDAIVDAFDTMSKKRLRLDDDIFSIAYTGCQYGNDWEEVLVNENGVVGLNHLPTPTVRRVEKLNGSLIGYVQDVTGRFTADQDELRKMLVGNTEIPRHVAVFEDWQAIHFRLRSTTRRSPYGVSVAEGARWIWKRLVMLEDAVMIYKLTRAPARYAFYVDVTDVPSNRVEGFLKKAKRDLKKRKMVNPNTNFLDMRYNPIANDEDFVIAVREGRALSRVEVLSGPDYQNIDDVGYFQKKLHGALMVPAAYMGQDAPIQSKSILSNEDVRAARVTLQVQKALREGIESLTRIDWAARGHPNPKALDFEVHMTVPSGIYELAALEVRNARAEFASRMMPFASMRWIMEHVFKFSDEEVAQIEKQRKKEAEEADAMSMNPSFGPFTGGDPRKAQQEQQAQQAAAGAPGAPAAPGAPGEPQAPAQPGLEPQAPAASAPQVAWKAYDQLRRLEEYRHRESRAQHQQLMDQLGRLMESDKDFAARLDSTRGFMKEVRDATLRKQNGHLLAVPSAPVNRLNRTFNGR